MKLSSDLSGNVKFTYLIASLPLSEAYKMLKIFRGRLSFNLYTKIRILRNKYITSYSLLKNHCKFYIAHKVVEFTTTTTKIITRAMLVAKQRVGLPFDLSSDYSIR